MPDETKLNEAALSNFDKVAIKLNLAKPGPNDYRPCGTCYACCVAGGVAELKKYPNQACRHLDGANPQARCSIYETRPAACVKYSCAWRIGLGPDDFRPDKSGLLIAYYLSELNDSMIAATIVVLDSAKAGTLTAGNLAMAIDSLIRAGLNDLRIVSYNSKSVVHFYEGKIRQGNLLPNDKGDYEGLKFMTFNPPIGHYEVQNKE